MNNRKLSAKDIAFENERIEFRKKINGLKKELSNRELEVSHLKETILQMENTISEKDDWIQRLLEYMDISEEDIKQILEKEKKEAKILNNLSVLGNMLKIF